MEDSNLRIDSPPSVADSVRRLGEGVTRLVRDHLALARTEIRRDLQTAARDIFLMAAGLPSVLLGYALLMVALSLVLGRWVGSTAAGFAIGGALNVLFGVFLAAYFARRLATRDKPDLDHTAGQIEEDRRWLKDLRRT